MVWVIGLVASVLVSAPAAPAAADPVPEQPTDPVPPVFGDSSVAPQSTADELPAPPSEGAVDAGGPVDSDADFSDPPPSLGQFWDALVGRRDVAEPPVLSEPGRGFDDDASTRMDDRTTERVEVYANPDGTETMLVSPEPVRFRDPSGDWVDYDLDLVDSGDGALVAEASDSGVRVPLDPVAEAMVTVDTGAGRLAWSLPDVLSVEGGAGGVVEVLPAQHLGSVSDGAGQAVPDPSTPMDDANAAVIDGDGDVDGVVEVTKDGFEQSVVVGSAEGPSSYRVVVELPPGVVARNVETAPGFSAHVEFVGADGVVVGMFGSGVAHDSAAVGNGVGALGAVTTSVASQDATAAVLEVALDTGWFGDPARVFPVTIDPTWSRSARDDGYDTHVQENLPTSSGWSSDVLYVGDYAANTTARAFVTFTDLPAGAPSGQFFVTDADLVMYNSYANTCDQRSIQVEGLFEDFSAATTWNDQPVIDPYGVEGSAMVPLSPCALGFHTWDVTGYARRWFEGTQAYMAAAAGYTGADFGLRLSATDEGDPLTWRAFRSGENTNPGAPVLAVTYETRPAAPVHSSPEDGAHLLEVPTLEVDPVADPDGDPVKYWFRVWSTPSEFENGLVLNSGWIDDPSWTPPAESFEDGVSYTWRAYATDQETTPMWSLATRTFVVDGHPAYAPTDAAGPYGVDLATGNVTSGWSGPELPTVEGSFGVGASYDAQSALPESDLTGSYFNDGNDNESFDDDVVIRRSDPSVSFIWTLAGGPYPELETGEWLARWEGFVEVPQTGSYEFGTVHHGKTRVVIDGTTVLDRWSQVAYEEAPVYDASPVTLSAGELYPIAIEFAAPGPIWGIPTDGFVELWAKGAVNEQRVDGSWLSPKQYEAHEALPDGWTLGAASYAGFTHAEVGNDTVAIKDSFGYGLVFNRTEDGAGWEPAEEWNTATLVDDATGAGQLTLQADGWTYVFDGDGKLVAASSPVTEGDTAPSHTYETITIGGIDYQRLTTIGDSVSGRSILLAYEDGSGGCPAAPPGFDPTPPTGMLCEVSYWDGTATELYYVGGQLGRVTNPGAAVTDFTYDGAGLLAGVRDPLAADAVAAGVRADDGTTFWEVAYDTGGRAVSITGPEPAPGEARPVTSYSYATAYTDVHVAGLAEPNGFTRRAAYHPDFGRQVTDTTADGLTSTIEYDDLDRPWMTTDGTGMKASTIFNDWGLATDTYGPAPAAWFGADGLPQAGYVAQTPHNATGYDEFNTLGATWWDNTEMEGAPVSSDMGVGTAGGEIAFSWSSHPDVAFITGNNYSGRLTGLVNLAQAGEYTIEIVRNAKVTAFVDGTLVGSDWEGTSQTMSATVQVDEPGWKPIMIGFAHPGSGNASLELRWKTPGSGSTVVVPGTALRPQMGVATSQTGPDGEVTAMGYEDPATGMATSSTADPGGEDLTQSFAYEAAGEGYRRMLSRTLPAGPDTEVTYAYYGDSETRDNPCTPEADAANQAGAPKLSTGADPDGAGGQGAITSEWVYDATGRVVAQRRNDDDWTCTTYDSRGRPVTVNYPAWGGEPARTVITNTTAITGGGSAGHADLVLADEPLAYWRLGESSSAGAAVDASGNGNDGDYNGTVSVGVGGAIEADTAA
ncbi:MAG: DNRLRE domain-containing protein, partial [Actinobacteria bacterium]